MFYQKLNKIKNKFIKTNDINKINIIYINNNYHYEGNNVEFYIQ